MEIAAAILEVFEDTVPQSGETTGPGTTSTQRDPLLEYIDYVPFPIDHIVKRSGLTATTVSSMLIGLGTARSGSMRRWRVSTRSRAAPAITSRTHGDVIPIHRA